MAEFIADLWMWFVAVLKSWVIAVGAPLVAFFQIWYGINYQTWPPVMSWVVLGVCFLAAMFLAWREEHRKAKGKPRQVIVRKIVDHFRKLKLPGELQMSLMALLIEYSADFGDYRDLDRVCCELEQKKHGNPFDLYFLKYTRGSFDKKKRFKFINDARVERAGRDRIISDTDADNYMSNWADENHLEERPEMRERAFRTSD
jgi:hypothetical protein